MRSLFEFLEFLAESGDNSVSIYNSNEFREMLSIIDSKSRGNTIANKLLTAESNHQYGDTFTLVDMTDKNDTLSIIPTSKIQRLIDTDDDVKSVANNISKDKLVYTTYHAFLNQKRGHVWSDKMWKTNRSEIKIGRYTRRVLKNIMNVDVKDSSIEEFVNLYKSTFDYRKGLKDKIKIVSGEEIRKWYYEVNYTDGGGSLNNSCMRYIKCQKFFDIYVKNPEVCRMLILEEDGKLNARTLIWTLQDGKIFMDRVYSVYDSDIEIFKNYASDNGWVTYYQSEKETGKLLVQLGKHEYEMYPYMDTLAYYNPKTYQLTDDSSSWGKDEYYQLQNTNGDYELAGVWSEWSQDYLNPDDAVWCDNVDTYLHADEAVYLEYINQWAAPNDDIVHDKNHHHYYRGDVKWSECQEDWLYIYIKIIDGDKEDICDPVRTDLYYEKDGKYYKKDNTNPNKPEDISFD
jgi:hypothetical protein